MKTLCKRSAFLVLLALAACTAQTETLPDQQTATLGDHLPEDTAIIEIYAAPNVFMSAVPYYAAGLRLINSDLVQHIKVKDAALYAQTLESLRAVRVAPDDVNSPFSCTEVSNPFGMWILGNGTMLLLWAPLSELKTAKKDDYSAACLQIGDESHWLKVSHADVWRAIKPLVK